MTTDHTNFRLALICGGAKSGKSSYAQRLAESCPGPRLYVATAEALDDEMHSRIARHQELRGPQWQTREESLDLVTALQEDDNLFGVILVDCLTLWLSNLLTRPPHKQMNPALEIDRLVTTLTTLKTPLLLVSNEVGGGIVPDNALAREFRDLSGSLNQRLAQLADRVVLVVCGLPLVLKPQAPSPALFTQE
jgi:adenosylcobinamide kinase / adenosylcobinamide-phosphate guanylyltransferase